MEEETKIRKMSLKEYLIRLVIWIAVLTVAPITYLEINYGLFTNNAGMALTGWGVVGVIFLAIIAFYILNQIKNGFMKGTMLRQCFDGFLKLIPIVAVVIVIHYIKESAGKMEGFLVVVIACLAISIPINPNPKWAMQNNIKTLSEVLNSVFKRFRDNKD